MSAPFIFILFLAVLIPSLCWFSNGLLDDLADRILDHYDNKKGR